MPTITKRELLAKVFAERLASRAFAESDRIVPSGASEDIVLRTARALGYTVTDEPELPERLSLTWAERSFSAGESCYALVDTKNYWDHAPRIMGWYMPSGSFPDKDKKAAVSELVRRYNAKTAVLAVAEELERLVGGYVVQSETFTLLARRLRAAYADDQP